MARETSINVFCKVVNDGDGKSFKVYSTKTPSGAYYKIRFIQDCTNVHLIPNNTKPFVLVTDNFEAGTKKRVSNTTGDTYIDNILYIKSIVRIEEYISPEIDFNTL